MILALDARCWTLAVRGSKLTLRTLARLRAPSNSNFFTAPLFNLRGTQPLPKVPFRYPPSVELRIGTPLEVHQLAVCPSHRLKQAPRQNILPFFSGPLCAPPFGGTCSHTQARPNTTLARSIPSKTPGGSQCAPNQFALPGLSSLRAPGSGRIFA